MENKYYNSCMSCMSVAIKKTFPKLLSCTYKKSIHADSIQEFIKKKTEKHLRLRARKYNEKEEKKTTRTSL